MSQIVAWSMNDLLCVDDLRTFYLIAGERRRQSVDLTTLNANATWSGYIHQRWDVMAVVTVSRLTRHLQQ